MSARPQMPTATEIHAAAEDNGFGTLTPRQAAKIHAQLCDVRDHEYGRDTLLELAMIGAQSMHRANLANMTAALVDEIGAPPGFTGTPDGWGTDRDGRVVRHWCRAFDTHSDAGVYLTVTDEAVDGSIVRSAPVLEVTADTVQLDAGAAHSLVDALQAALRVLGAVESHSVD